MFNPNIRIMYDFVDCQEIRQQFSLKNFMNPHSPYLIGEFSYFEGVEKATSSRKN